MRKLFLIIIFLTLISCAYIRPHRIDIEQGNIITEHDFSKLRKGMSEADVREIMGNPVLINVFTPDSLDYVYRLKKGYQVVKEQKLICLFKHGKLINYYRQP